MAEPDPVTQERIARNDDAFRRANRRIAAVASGLPLEKAPFICECADPRCTAIVGLSQDEYAEIRASPRRFFCVPDHLEAAEGMARVVTERDGYLVVEKVGHAGEVAEQLDRSA